MCFIASRMVVRIFYVFNGTDFFKYIPYAFQKYHLFGCLFSAKRSTIELLARLFNFCILARARAISARRLVFRHLASAKIRVRIGRRIVNIQLESARVRAIVPIAPEIRQITGVQIRIIGEKADRVIKHLRHRVNFYTRDCP